jgi:uncharacterized protein
MKTILYKLNPWWEGENALHETIPRLRYLQQLKGSLDLRGIVMVTGLRRVGKTTLLRQLIDDMLADVAPADIFYVSLDAYGLESYSIHEIVEQYRMLHRHQSDRKIYLFLDEVTAKPDFNRELKDFYDHENVKIYTSASSASLFRDQKAHLTGRTRTLEVLPLDFEEYLVFKDVQISAKDDHLRESYFMEYLETGGLPEYVLTGDIVYLTELIDSILHKDIIAFHGLKDVTLVRDFFRLLMERAGKQFTANRVANILGISVDTVRRYMSCFLKTYLIYTIERCGKLNQRLRSPQKVYAGDVGIRNLATGFRDKGAVFENLVYLRIKHRNPCYVLENGNEIDFLFDDVLMEVKLNQPLSGKQRALFEAHPAREKRFISSPGDFLDQIWSSKLPPWG